MEKDEIIEKIKFLTYELNKHNYNYYVLDIPVISDYEFDTMLEELRKLEEEVNFRLPESPVHRIGGQINKQFKQYRHKYPMQSIENTYSIHELREFQSRLKKIIYDPVKYVCELKYDGVAVGLHYENGILVRAVTRGDGIFGDIITDNIKTIRSIPLKVFGDNYPTNFEVRCEVFMEREKFEKFNIQRTESGEPAFANPRNATSGSLKLQNSTETATRPLDYYLYSILGDTLLSDSHYENMQYAKKLGFKVSPHIKLCDTFEEVENYIALWEKKRLELKFDIDGIVIKADSYLQQNKLGFTAKSPRWATAYKYKAEQASTQLLSVDFYVGRTGVITPVANLAPVELSGSIVKRASLHNADIITKLDVKLGDYVYVEKGGEIIPKITGVDLTRRNQFNTEIIFPQNCPACHTKLIRIETEAQHYCLNDKNCPPQIKGKIEHFVSRKAMNISSLGPEKIELLFEKNLILNVADLYKLKYEQLLGLDKTYEDTNTGKKRTVTFQHKTVKNILENIEQTKNIPFERVLYALGIRYVGETVASRIASACMSIDNIKGMSLAQLTEIDEVGEKIAQSIVNYFADENNLKIIDFLKSSGLQMETTAQEELISNKLEGQQIVISGVFSISREEIKKIIEQHGGNVLSSVSKNTDFILAGENIGQSKLKKAMEMNIPVITELEFRNKIEK